MTPSKILLYFCLSFVGGIFLNSIVPISQIYLLGFLILGILLISVFWPFDKLRASSFDKLRVSSFDKLRASSFGKDVRLSGSTVLSGSPPKGSVEALGASSGKKQLVVIGFCILFLVLGIGRHQSVELGIINNELRKFNDQEQNIILIGIVSAEPDARETNTKLTVESEQLTIDPENASLPLGNEAGNQQLAISGKFLITTRKHPQYQYGDKLKITGRLEAPQELGDFDYPGYLAKDGIYSVMYWPKIELLGRESYRDPLSVMYAKILSFKNRLRESIYQNLSPPQSSILGAMILGDKHRMSQGLKEKLNIAGVRHITAVSGMHVVILSGVLMSLLIGLGLWRQQAFYFTIIFVWLFIIMTGFQPSGIRAGIMGGLFLLAQYSGRPSNSSRAVVLAATVMLAANPLLLKLDVGFQLSFLAVIGIIYLGPLFRGWISFVPEEKFINLRNILVMTFSAQVFTLPILVYNFGRMSLVAPITNILILPSIYWIMILGFIFGLIGILWSPLGWILSWPAWLLLTYLTKIVDWFSRIPLAALTLEIHWIWLAISYLILGLIIWRLQEKFSRPIFLR